MRYALLILALLLTACPEASSPVDGEPCSAPPTLESVEADGVEWDNVLLSIRADSEEWSPHILLLEAWDIGRDDEPVQVQPFGTDGWSRTVIGVDAETGEAELEILVTDPRGCEASTVFTASL